MKKSFICFLTICLLCQYGPELVAQLHPVPSITLANSIKYADTSYTDLPGNGFLLDTGDEILAVTCKHSLWVNRAKEMHSVDFKGKLREWKMVVPNDPSQYVILGDMINTNSNESIGESNTRSDFLVFRIKENHSRIHPVKLSPIAVQPGDTLFQVGWTFAAKKGDPQSYPAVAVGYSGPVLLINSIARKNIAGLSGSPVINSKNELVAIVSTWEFNSSAGNWLEAPCSTDYLWEVLYADWLTKNNKQKDVTTHQEYLADFGSRNGIIPTPSSYLVTELFFGDWLQSQGKDYGCPEDFTRWLETIDSAYPNPVTADNYRTVRLIFDGWKKDHLSGKAGTDSLEMQLADKGLPLPGLSDFCDYAMELLVQGMPDLAVALLLFADEKIQHMGQLYAYLGHAYLAKGEIESAKDAYVKCMNTYPEYPIAVDGLMKLNEIQKKEN